MRTTIILSFFQKSRFRSMCNDNAVHINMPNQFKDDMMSKLMRVTFATLILFGSITAGHGQYRGAGYYEILIKKSAHWGPDKKWLESNRFESGQIVLLTDETEKDDGNRTLTWIKTQRGDWITDVGIKSRRDWKPNQERPRSVNELSPKRDDNDSSNLEDLLKTYVETAIKKWQVKGEFEKTVDYQLRVSATSWEAKVEQLQEEALSIFETGAIENFDLTKTSPKALTLGLYDADNETFLIEINEFGSIILGVPIDEAPSFKESFDPKNFYLANLGYSDGTWIITKAYYRAEAKKSNNGTVIVSKKNYHYDVSKEREYGNVTINYDFGDVDIKPVSINIGANQNINNRVIEKSGMTPEIQFNQVPKNVVVETVAVVPVDGKDCSGQTVSGQDIASFTEGSLLGLYNVVERRNLERVLDEQRLALSGILYEKSAVEAGCNVGAQGIIFTEYGCLTGQETIQLKLVDCQTSELYWSATGVNATAQETLDKVRQELEDQ